MTSQEFQEIQERSGKTNREVAQHLGVHIRTVKRYRNGGTIRDTIAKLMRTLA